MALGPHLPETGVWGLGTAREPAGRARLSLGLAPRPQVLLGDTWKEGQGTARGAPAGQGPVKKVSVVSFFISGNNSPFELLG